MMTLEDMVESGIEFQGIVEVRVYENGKTETVFDGDGDDLRIAGLGNDWYDMRPLTFIYASDANTHPADKGFVLEVDGEEED